MSRADFEINFSNSGFQLLYIDTPPHPRPVQQPEVDAEKQVAPFGGLSTSFLGPTYSVPSTKAQCQLPWTLSMVLC